MDENLEEIKQRLINEHYKQERRSSMDQLRALIYNQAILDVQFSHLDTQEKDVVDAVNKIIEELQDTSQEEIRRTLNPTKQVRAFWRSPNDTDLKKCHRCQEYYLSLQLQFCNPFLIKPEYSVDLLDPRYGHYCKPCIIAIRQENTAKIMDEIIHCSMCQKSLKRYQLFEDHRKFQDVYKTLLKPGFGAVKLPGSDSSCFDCMQQYVKVCCLCDNQYISQRANDEHNICAKCRTPEIIEEAKRVTVHNRRAVDLRLIANLALPQWLATLKYFDNRCAYCSGPYVGLEHYLPLSLGGGTTASNCLPSCSSCNARKGDRHPDTFQQLFPVDNLTNIQMWLGA